MIIRAKVRKYLGGGVVCTPREYIDQEAVVLLGNETVKTVEDSLFKAIVLQMNGMTKAEEEIAVLKKEVYFRLAELERIVKSGHSPQVK